MTRLEPATETIDTADAREQWDTLLDRVRRREARFLIEREGKPVAAIVSVRELEIFERYLRQRAKDFEVIDQIRDAFKDVPDDEIEREVAKAIAEVRAENRDREQANSVAATS